MVLFLILFAGVILSGSSKEHTTTNIMYPGFVLDAGHVMQVTDTYDIGLFHCRVMTETSPPTYLTPKVTEYCDKGWHLKFQTDGNLVLYDDTIKRRWASDTGGKGYTKAWVDTKNNKFSFA
jgi:hypothetical protein